MTKLSLSVFQIVQPAQLKNGLRYQDYSRYGKYCARKLYRLKKASKCIGGKKRFKSMILPDIISDARILETLLFSSERAWALGTELNARAAGLDQHSSILEHHKVGRFRRAAMIASELHKQCVKFCDDETIAEASAYSNLMATEYYIQKERYDDALEPLLAARETLARFVVISRHSEAYKTRMDSLEPIFRLLKFHTSAYRSPTRGAIHVDSDSDARIVAMRRSELHADLEICTDALIGNRDAKDGFAAVKRALECLGMLRLLPSGSDRALEISRSIQILTALKCYWVAKGLFETMKNLEAAALLRSANFPIDFEVAHSPIDKIFHLLPLELQKLRLLTGARLLGDSLEPDSPVSMASADEEMPDVAEETARETARETPVQGVLGRLTGWLRS